MLQIQQIDHVVLRVADIDKALAFYTEVIGCTVERVQDELGLYQLRAGSSLVDLITLDGKLGAMGGAAPGKQGRNMDHFCLQVDPFDGEAIAAHLRAHNVEPGEVQSRYGALGQGPSLYIHDPDNNVVELKGPPFAE